MLRNWGIWATVAVGLLVSGAFADAPTTITYQGTLEQNGAGVNASVPMVFRLYDAPTGGGQIGPSVNNPAVGVSGGLFTESLDFGAVPAGTTGLWLEIVVDGFVMSPRQAVSASPYSLQTRGIHVNEAGQVGIGIESPGRALDVNGDGAAVRVRSSTLNPARLELRGDIDGLGGVYSQIEFENELGVEEFTLRHDNGFGTEYLTLLSAIEPLGIFRIRDDGKLAMGDVPSIATAHITDRDIGVYPDGMLNETLALEDNDAVLGIYSSNTGSFGSGIALGESVGNALVDKWGLVRTTSNTSPELRVTYGTNANYAQNPLSLKFVPGGIEFADGSVQSWAGVVDSWGTSRFVSTQITSGGVLPDPGVVTISASGQSVLVTVFAEGTHGADGESNLRCVIAHRPFGSSATPTEVTYPDFFYEDNTGSVNTFEGFQFSGTMIIRGLPVGTHEIGVFMRQEGNAGLPAFAGKKDISLIVF